jgi:hypothetical protein
LLIGQNSIVKPTSRSQGLIEEDLLLIEFRSLKPGGFIELIDLSLNIKSDDGTVTEDGPLQQWYRVFLEAGEKMGKTFEIFDHAKDYITDAGFVDIKETVYKVPIGGWSSDPKSKEIGRWNLLQINQGLEGFALFILSSVLGVSNTSTLHQRHYAHIS